MWVQLLGGLTELPSVLLVAMAVWSEPPRAFPMWALRGKVLPAHLSCPCCCGCCVLPVSTRQTSARTPFWHATANCFFFYHCYWVIFTNCTESCSPQCSYGCIRLLLPPAGGAAGHQSPGIPVFWEPSTGLEWQLHGCMVAQGEPSSGSWLEEVTVPPWVLAMPAAWALRQEGWAVPWGAVCQVQADIRLTGGSLVGFGRLL